MHLIITNHLMNRVKTHLNIDQVGHTKSPSKEGVNKNVTRMLNKELIQKSKEGAY